jgi:hypothetical protein
VLCFGHRSHEELQLEFSALSSSGAGRCDV